MQAPFLSITLFMILLRTFISRVVAQYSTVTSWYHYVYTYCRAPLADTTTSFMLYIMLCRLKTASHLNDSKIMHFPPSIWPITIGKLHHHELFYGLSYSSPSPTSPTNNPLQRLELTFTA